MTTAAGSAKQTRDTRAADTCPARTAVRTAVFLAALLAGCGDGDGAAVAVDAATDAPPETAPADAASDVAPPDTAADALPDAAVPPLDVRFQGGFARKARRLADGRTLVLVEAPGHLRVDFGRPRRELRVLGTDGEPQYGHGANPGLSLLDFAHHASGALTLLLAGDDGYRLIRMTIDGRVLAAGRIDDPKLSQDEPPAAPGEPMGPIDPAHHDGGRIIAAGDEVALALRSGRHSVVYHRVAFVDGAPSVRQRVLAIPAVRIYPIGLTGGSHDTFGQLEGRYGVHLAVDESGVAYVAVRAPDLAELRLRRAFRDVFGEALQGDDDGADGYVVRIAPDGRRLGTSVVGTPQQDELYGLAAGGGAAWAVGRTETWNDAGTGHDALVARVDGATGAVTVRVLDIDRGDVAFDAAATAAGVLVVGASGYTQNPRGASVSEESAAFARFITPGGTVVPVPMPVGPRHNEGRVAVPLGGARFLVGGMLDGPGTHSADAVPALLRARGFVTELDVP